MRTPFIVGNWKMNTDLASGSALSREIAQRLGSRSDVEIAVCPPFPYLLAVQAEIAATRIGLGGQNCAAETKGAFTGEVSPAMLMDVGCVWVILGHSERRHLLGESDPLVGKKARVAVEAGLKVILAVGETASERQENQTEAVVARQLDHGLKGLSATQLSSLVIAYEPVWAIGTGVNATPEQAQAVHHFIRTRISHQYGDAVAHQLRIQYGGSVNPGNAAALFAQADIDGFLVGGASLKAEDFSAIVEHSVGKKRE